MVGEGLEGGEVGGEFVGHFLEWLINTEKNLDVNEKICYCIVEFAVVFNIRMVHFLF